MNKPWILFLLYVVLISGCVQIEEGRIGIDISKSSIIGRTSLADLSNNPEAYVKKEVNVEGKMVMGFSLAGGTSLAYLEDNKGYRLRVMLPGEFVGSYWNMGNRALYPGESYTIHGVYSANTLCSCQMKLRKPNWGNPNPEWLDDVSHRIIKVEDCLRLSGYLVGDIPDAFSYRCKPGSEQREYYLAPLEIN